MTREIIFWGDYFEIFYSEQDVKVKRKINYVLWLICATERVPEKFLKHLDGSEGLYEIRISSTFKEIRILSFFDENNLMVLINCFLKKSRKISKNEIKLGQKLKKEYFDYKISNKK